MTPIIAEFTAGPIPVFGSLVCEPTQRTVTVGVVQLPTPQAPIAVVAGVATFNLPPTNVNYCWHIREMFVGGLSAGRYVNVPDSTVVINYADLVDVDPASFMPAPTAPTVTAAAAADATAKVAVETTRATAAESANTALVLSETTARSAAVAAEATARQVAVDARTIVDVVQVSASGALPLNRIVQCDATAGALTMVLPTGAPAGAVIVVEKADTSVNPVTATGSIRGVGGSSLTVTLPKESIKFTASASGSWSPEAGHKTLKSMDDRFSPKFGPYPFRRRDFNRTASPLLLAQPTVTTAPTMIFAQTNAGPINYRRVDYPLSLPTAPSAVAGPCLAYGGTSMQFDTYGTAAVRALSLPVTTPTYTFETITDDPCPEFLSYSNNTMSCRMLINGQYIGSSSDFAPTITSGGSYQRLVVLNGPATTLAAAASAGATSVSLTAAPNFGDTLALNPNSGGNPETTVVTGAPTGSGPYAVPVRALVFAHSSGETAYICTRQLRRYKLLTPGNWPLKAIGIDKASTMFPPPEGVPTRVGWLTDSFGQANSLDSIPQVTSRALGWEPVIDAEGGTGYVSVGPQNRPFTDPDRAARLANSPAVDKLIIWGSVNDNGQSGVQAAATAVLTTALASGRLTAKDIFVIGPPTPNASSHTNLIPVNTAVAAACAAMGVAYIDQLTNSWITGSGNAGALANDGNADLVTSSDGVHPTLYGSQYLGLRTAAAIAALWSA